MFLLVTAVVVRVKLQQALIMSVVESRFPGEKASCVDNLLVDLALDLVIAFFVRSRPQYVEEIRKRRFISTARRTSHANLSVTKTKLFVNARLQPRWSSATRGI